jgi:hypothetical protein
VTGAAECYLLIQALNRRLVRSGPAVLNIFVRRRRHRNQELVAGFGESQAAPYDVQAG